MMMLGMGSLSLWLDERKSAGCYLTTFFVGGTGVLPVLGAGILWISGFLTFSTGGFLEGVVGWEGVEGEAGCVPAGFTPIPGDEGVAVAPGLVPGLMGVVGFPVAPGFVPGFNGFSGGTAGVAGVAGFAGLTPGSAGFAGVAGVAGVAGAGVPGSTGVMPMVTGSVGL
jgi:hypothetical protein